MKQIFLLLSCAVLLNAAELKIRSPKFGNWFVLDEPVVFKTETPLPKEESMTVRVYDSAGKKVAEETIRTETFQHDGWRWKAPHPGFFEAEFLRNGKTVTESYRLTLRKWDEIDRKKSSRLPNRSSPSGGMRLPWCRGTPPNRSGFRRTSVHRRISALSGRLCR